MRAPDPGAKLRELVQRPLVKVCGLTRQEDVDAAVEAGADIVGFILAAESPRRTDRLLDAPDTVLRVAVFVGEQHDRPTQTSSSSTRAKTVTVHATPCCSDAASTWDRSSTCRGARRILRTSRGRTQPRGA